MTDDAARALAAIKADGRKPAAELRCRAHRHLVASVYRYGQRWVLERAGAGRGAGSRRGGFESLDVFPVFLSRGVRHDVRFDDAGRIVDKGPGRPCLGPAGVGVACQCGQWYSEQFDGELLAVLTTRHTRQDRLILLP